VGIICQMVGIEGVAPAFRGEDLMAEITSFDPLSAKRIATLDASIERERTFGTASKVCLAGQ
jgi:hypothetical protein